MTTATRIEVGTCDMGNVFIFAQQSPDGETWMVRAGNHTVGTYDTEAGAEAVARALCGDGGLAVGLEATPDLVIAAAPEPEPEYAEKVRERVRKK